MNSIQEIKDYLISNPIDRSKQFCYKDTAEKFGVSTEKIRSIYKRLRKANLVETSINYHQVLPIDHIPYTYTTSSTDNTMTITTGTDEEVRSLEDLIRVCDIDVEEWIIKGWECSNSNGRYRVCAKLIKRGIDTDAYAQKNELIKELYAKSPKAEKIDRVKSTSPKLLEISIPDIHFGKMSHRDETGEDYDLKIAEARFKTAIDSLLENINIANVDRILFPIGNDLINFDNKNNTTTQGTPQDSDSRFHKVVKTVKRILIETIDYLSQLAPVDIVIVPGNHDETITFTIGEILDAYYHNNDNVRIDNSAKLRKYYCYYNVGIQLTHGDKEAHSMLGLIFATEKPQIWGSTIHRYCQLGHFHKTKKLNFVSVDEYPGFQIQIIPSLSGTDAWHYGKGYMSKKTAKAFLFDKKNGLIAEFNHNI